MVSVVLLRSQQASNHGTLFQVQAHTKIVATLDDHRSQNHYRISGHVAYYLPTSFLMCYIVRAQSA